MIAGLRSGCALAVVATILLLAPAVALAHTGKLVDPDGKPIEGARVCYILNEAEGLCAESDADGLYQLPVDPLGRIRIAADGFMMLFVPSVAQTEPIVMTRAATLQVLLKNSATGETIAGQIFLVNPSGRRQGPIPVAKKGLTVGRLPAGKYRVLGKVDGLTQHRSVSIELVAGKKAEVVIELVPPQPAGAAE